MVVGEEVVVMVFIIIKVYVYIFIFTLGSKDRCDLIYLKDKKFSNFFS